MRPLLSCRSFVRRAGLGLAAITLAGLTGGCGDGGSRIATGALTGHRDAKSAHGPVQIALILPLSGDPQLAALGRAMRQAAELAIFEINRPELQLLVKDDRGTEAGARAAAEQALGEGAEIILGPLTSSATRAVAPVAQRAGLPIVSFSNDASAAGPGVHLLSFAPEDEVRNLVAHLGTQGRRRIAVMAADDSYGQVVAAALAANARAAGVEVVVRERHRNDEASISAAARRLAAAAMAARARDAAIDTVLLAGPGEAIPGLARSIRNAGVDTRSVAIAATSGWDIAAGRPRAATYAAALDDVLVAAPDPERWRDFARRFVKLTGKAPPRLATLSYDAVGLVGSLAGAPKGQRFTAARLSRPEGFEGVDGRYRMTANGRLERVLDLARLAPTGPALVARGSPTGAPARSSPIAQGQ